MQNTIAQSATKLLKTRERVCAGHVAQTFSNWWKRLSYFFKTEGAKRLELAEIAYLNTGSLNVDIREGRRL